VLHHLRAMIEDPRHVIAIVGFQAEHTLGRRIAERRPRVKIFGVMHDLHAEVLVLQGFSAHADQAGLVAFAEAVRARGELREVLLVHGEPGPQAALTTVLAGHGFPRVAAPGLGEHVVIRPA